MLITLHPIGAPEDCLRLVDGWTGNRLAAGQSHGEIYTLERNGLEGWFEPASPRVSIDTIPGSDGAYWPDTPLLSPRIVTIRGFHVASRRSTLSAARFRDRLAAWATRPLRLVVDDTPGVRTATGVLSDQIVINRKHEAVTKFSLIVTCPDPLKYSPPTHYPVSSGKVFEAENNGTAPVFPEVRFSHCPVSVRVAYDGGRLEWSAENMNILDPAVLSLESGQMLLDNGRAIGSVLDLDLPRFQPGSQTVGVAWEDAQADTPSSSKLLVSAGWY